jgi:site-specific DNA recombinase
MFGRLTTKRERKTGEVVRSQYYICSNRHANNSCDMPMFRQVHVEHLTMEYIRKIKTDVDLIKQESKNLTREEDKKVDELAQAKRELAKISERREKWQFMFVDGLITKEEVRKRILEEDENEKEVKQRIAALQNVKSGIPNLDGLAEMEEIWEYLDDAEKKDVVFTLFKKITVNTDLKKVKGVKNKFFDAYIQEILFN